MFMARNAFFASGVRDPFWANVVLLAHFDGTNGQTTTVDSGPLALTMTRAGSGCVLSTTQVKFGTTSTTGATTGYWSASNAALALGTGDYTVEMFAYWQNPSSGTNRRLFEYNSSVLPSVNGQLAIYAASATQYGIIVAGTASTVGGASALTANTWQHVAITRTGGTLRLFVNGNLEYSVADSTNLTSQAFTFLGGFSTSFLFDGFMDEVRITKGVARYTANFTVPTSAFPNS